MIIRARDKQGRFIKFVYLRIGLEDCHPGNLLEIYDNGVMVGQILDNGFARVEDASRVAKVLRESVFGN